MKCLKCETIIDGSYGSGKYCSRKCSNSRTHSQTVKDKIKDSFSKSEKRKKFVLSQTGDNFSSERKERVMKTWFNKLLKREFETLFQSSKKRIILFEQDFKCKNCGLTEWMGKPITLELDHIDGDHNNNKRENFRCICPNCHAQTGTWRKSNKPKFKNALVV